MKLLPESPGGPGLLTYHQKAEKPSGCPGTGDSREGSGRPALTLGCSRAPGTQAFCAAASVLSQPSSFLLPLLPEETAFTPLFRDSIKNVSRARLTPGQGHPSYQQ